MHRGRVWTHKVCPGDLSVWGKGRGTGTDEAEAMELGPVSRETARFRLGGDSLIVPLSIAHETPWGPGKGSPAPRPTGLSGRPCSAPGIEESGSQEGRVTAKSHSPN